LCVSGIKRFTGFKSLIPNFSNRDYPFLKSSSMQNIRLMLSTILISFSLAVMAQQHNPTGLHSDFPTTHQFAEKRYYLTDGTFTVPEGVTRILVEAWGGGGGGMVFLGGGSGGYAAGFFNVSAGNQVSITIGAGGVGSNSSPEDINGTPSGAGGNTTITVLSNSIIAQGGQGITVTDILSPSGRTLVGGKGGGFSFAGPANRMVYGVRGNDGVVGYGNTATNNYYGRGGDAPVWPYRTGGEAAYHITNFGITGGSGARPGGGGGTIASEGENKLDYFGANGGSGMVRISY